MTAQRPRAFDRELDCANELLFTMEFNPDVSHYLVRFSQNHKYTLRNQISIYQPESAF